MRAFLLSAGLGTRLKPLTDTTPKALVQINGVTLLEHIIKRLISFGFDSIIINVHHFGDQVINFLKEKNNFGVDIKISDERDQLLDTGGGLKKVSEFFNDDKPFLVHNVDILSDLNLFELYHYHLRSNSIATLAVQNRKSSRYFLFDEDKNLCGWKNEKPLETKIARQQIGSLIQLAFSGIQIIDPKIFQFMPEKNIFSLIDLYLSIASKERISYFDHSGSLFIDLGKTENLMEAEKIIKVI
ncbi:MAG: nucleotidyltransferase family protein [Ignavibacteriales bacterium]|nr:nucleotidyltransferase family protein [Ignavibacteriales bacterium]